MLDKLIAQAIREGASAATVVNTDDIVVEDHLAELCLPPKCPNYGTSAGCPPHVGGPGEMRKRLASAELAIVIKIDIPSPAMLSDADTHRELFGLLTEIAADMEETAARQGYAGATAYSGAGCKQVFCGEHAECRVIGKGDTCRHPHRARPSMSGFGVNVGRLMQSAGWDAPTPGKKAAEDDLFSICAMVLIG